MKRWLSLLCAAVLLLTCTGCKNTQIVDQERVTYTAFPTALSLQSVGTMERRGTAAAGGLYYRIGERYGITSFDGTADSGAIYKVCQPLLDAFTVAKETGDAADPISLNTAGLVDAQGTVIVPLQYASVTAVDNRFIRVVEITGTCAEKKDAITEFTKDNGDVVYCTGNWYIYDITTGKRVPDATGTHPYAAYSYGSKYIKYVSDDKVEHIVNAEGIEYPAEAIHLKNGYYVMEQECAVYDADGARLFTYDPNGYIPTDNKDITDYILGKKTVEGKDVYALMDCHTGAVVAGELEAVPTVHGAMLHVNKMVLNLRGEPMFENPSNTLYMDPWTEQAWMMTDSVTKEKIVFDKDGNKLYSTTDNISFTVNYFALQQKDGDTAYNLLLKDGSYSIKGTMLAPWLARVTNEDSTCNLVDTISGTTLLEGYNSISVAGGDEKPLYVYAVNAEDIVEIYCVR